jgi:hypothetical protein
MFSLAGSGLQRVICLMAILVLIFSLLTFNAFPGDSLMYHLPYPIRFWYLDSGPFFQRAAFIDFAEPLGPGRAVLDCSLITLSLLASQRPGLFVLPRFPVWFCIIHAGLLYWLHGVILISWTVLR